MGSAVVLQQLSRVARPKLGCALKKLKRGILAITLNPSYGLPETLIGGARMANKPHIAF
jgi:hypothetical protein